MFFSRQGRSSGCRRLLGAALASLFSFSVLLPWSHAAYGHHAAAVPSVACAAAPSGSAFCHVVVAAESGCPLCQVLAALTETAAPSLDTPAVPAFETICDSVLYVPDVRPCAFEFLAANRATAPPMRRAALV